MKKKSLSLLASCLLLGSGLVYTSCAEKEEQQSSPEATDKPAPEQPDHGMDMSEELKAELERLYDAVSIDAQEVTDIHQLALLTSVNASRDGYGPISITPALLDGEEITLVTLGGTQMVEGQATGLQESQLASFGQPNDYLYALTERFKDGTIPAGKPVLLTGISLGGMIAQQLLGSEDVLASHRFKAIITFGSPITLPLDRKGVKVIRFADSNDKVPTLGEIPLNSGLVKVPGLDKEQLQARIAELHESERIMRTSKYTGMVETHALSYIEDPCWEGMDFMGDPDCTHKLELTATMQFYPAPKSR